MMREVEAGNVATIILKDMSRLGRDYLRVGLYMETMREHGVRLIAIKRGRHTFKIFYFGSSSTCYCNFARKDFLKIRQQKKELVEFTRNQGYVDYKLYIDNGKSGLTP